MRPRGLRTLMGIIAVTLFAAAVTIPSRLAAQDNKAKHHHYTLKDLGTFGGPNSSFNNPVPIKILTNAGIAARVQRI